MPHDDRLVFPRGFPPPAVSAETRPWWEAAAAHRLVVQRCAACGRLRHPPGPLCPGCRSSAREWMTVSGRGRVYTYTVVHRAFLPSAAAACPYIVVAVALEEAPGVRIVSNLVGAAPEDVRVDLPVEVVWDDLAPGLAVPRFRPAAGG